MYLLVYLYILNEFAIPLTISHGSKSQNAETLKNLKCAICRYRTQKNVLQISESKNINLYLHKILEG